MISEKDYLDTVKAASDLLANRGQKLVEAMYRQLEIYSERLEFERAESMLRHIRVLERQEVKQVVDREITFDQDVLYFGEDHVLVAKVQEGMLRDFVLHSLSEVVGQVSPDAFIARHYAGDRPDEIIINRLQDRKAVHTVLRQRGRGSMSITIPKRGLKLELLNFCKYNYEYRINSIAGK